MGLNLPLHCNTRFNPGIHHDFGFSIKLHTFTFRRNFSKDSLGTQPWCLSRLERAEDFGVILVRYLGVDRGSMLSSVAVLCLYLCGVHDVLAALVLSLARCAHLLSSEWASCICSLFVGSVHLSGKLP